MPMMMMIYTNTCIWYRYIAALRLGCITTDLWPRTLSLILLHILPCNRTNNPALTSLQEKPSSPLSWIASIYPNVMNCKYHSIHACMEIPWVSLHQHANINSNENMIKYSKYKIRLWNVNFYHSGVLDQDSCNLSFLFSCLVWNNFLAPKIKSKSA